MYKNHICTAKNYTFHHQIAYKNDHFLLFQLTASMKIDYNFQKRRRRSSHRFWARCTQICEFKIANILIRQQITSLDDTIRSVNKNKNITYPSQKQANPEIHHNKKAQRFQLSPKKTQKRTCTHLIGSASCKSSMVSSGPLYELCTSPSPSPSSSHLPDESVFLPIDELQEDPESKTFNRRLLRRTLVPPPPPAASTIGFGKSKGEAGEGLIPASPAAPLQRLLPKPADIAKKSTNRLSEGGEDGGCEGAGHGHSSLLLLLWTRINNIWRGLDLQRVNCRFCPLAPNQPGHIHGKYHK